MTLERSIPFVEETEICRYRDTLQAIRREVLGEGRTKAKVITHKVTSASEAEVLKQAA